MPAPVRTPVHRFVHSVARATLLVGVTFCHATNLNFLKDTPITYMRDADRKALNHAAQIALETKEDDESFPWSNAGTGNPVSISGTITPHGTTKQGDRTCRTATLVAIAKGQTQSWTPTVCKQGSGLWKILKQ